MTKTLLHQIVKPSHDDHNQDEPCVGEALDKSKNLTVRGLVDEEGTHWLAREDILEFVRKERDTFRAIFGHLIAEGSFEPQYLLGAQIINSLGAILDHSTLQEEGVESGFSDEALAAMLAGATPTVEEPQPVEPKAVTPEMNDAFGDIAQALRDLKKPDEGQPDQS